MLIQFKTSLKTTFILLLFITGGSLYSRNKTINSLENKNHTDLCINSLDTIKTIAPNKVIESDSITEFLIPRNLINEKIDFQINSDISYLSIKHFRKDESKKMFTQAWLKEKEVRRIAPKTDSLRKAYINSSDDRKVDISAQILSAEQRQISLNLEIPELYEKARTEEKQYWQSAPEDEKIKFEEKINQFRDSVRQATRITPEANPLFDPKVPDTITIYNPVPKAEVKPELNSGITYKIIIGAYKNKMPDSAAKAIKKLSMLRKVENYKDEKGVKVYTTGDLINYEEAVIMQNQVKQEGIKNASIAPYHNGKRISLTEAKKLTNDVKIP